jgi:hypothetical protein
VKDHAKQKQPVRVIDASPGNTLVVEIAAPTEAQLDNAIDRLADLFADLWARGLLDRPEKS